MKKWQEVLFYICTFVVSLIVMWVMLYSVYPGGPIPEPFDFSGFKSRSVPPHTPAPAGQDSSPINKEDL